MRELLFYSLETNLYLAVIILVHQFGFRKARNFSFSRNFLLVGILFSFVLPLIKLEALFANHDNSIITSLNSQIIIGINEVGIQNEKSVSIFNMIYLLISGLLFIKLLASLYKIWSLKKRSIKKVEYFQIPDNLAAFSFFKWIFIGDQIPKKDRAHILKHEQVHSKRFHSFDLLLCHTLEIFFWWNPFLYLLKKQFMELHEYEADEKSCTDSTAYIELLLRQNFNSYNTHIIHQFNSKHLKNRIMRIKQSSTKRISIKALISSLIILGLVFIFNNTLNSQESTLSKTSTKNLDVLTGLHKLTDPDNLDQANTHKIMEETGEVDKQAQFPGGQEALIKFMGKNVKYPEELKAEKISETIYIEFKVDQNGKLSNYAVKKRGNTYLEKTALDAMKKMPNWEPAMKDGKKVASIMVLPFRFVPNPPPPPPPPSLPE